MAFEGHILMIRFTANDNSVTVLISVKNDSVFPVRALCSKYFVCENICFAWLGGSYVFLILSIYPIITWKKLLLITLI